ncbi:hypothetical protein FEE96_19015 [Parasedimentitalea maritima]|uniref:Nuclear transport factor 2 family protein n=1 Tax=Parasedimentitalea maritima TaxID=2578117 RepID=A0ABY2URJ0_9RHOB|nr:hypothetical protein [Zongyanglinia marina]TLP58523.1 hypothetical protein FEE96_19015 [Zongyanglinia marina]
MQGYEETGRTSRELSLSQQGGLTIIMTTAKVAYEWDGFKGDMTEMDRFEITTVAGRAVIQKLTSTFDYR